MVEVPEHHIGFHHRIGDGGRRKEGGKGALPILLLQPAQLHEHILRTLRCRHLQFLLIGWQPQVFEEMGLVHNQVGNAQLLKGDSGVMGNVQAAL